MRSAIALILASLAVALASLLAGVGSAPASPAPARITIAMLPHGLAPAELARVPGLAPGLLSAGIGRVPAAQTYLDITQGNRVSESLYEEELPRLRRDRRGVARSAWQRAVERAEAAPADVVPGLLASTLEADGIAMRADTAAGQAELLAADRSGRIRRLDAGRCPPRGCAGVSVVTASLAQLRRRIGRLGAGDMLIAIERPPPGFRVLAMAVAAEDYEGTLTSDSTRTEGLVTTTDIAPTILERYGLEVPDETNGQEVTAEGERDPEALQSLSRRLRVTGERRAPVIGVNLLAWVVLTGLAAVIGGRRAARVALPLLALSVIYLPLVLLGTAALDPSELAERLIAGLGSPLLAGLTLALLRGWRAVAFASLVTVGAYAVDVVVGSPLTPLSLPGPNPASGSRFFGIGNEVEAIVAALVPIGVGAALAARETTRDGGPLAAASFVAAGLVAGAIFAIGRFGADVGAAIVLPAGAAVAAALCLRRRRAAVLVLLVPAASLAALVLVDLLLGGGAHLTSSLLEAGGLDEVGDVFERRIRLAGHSFLKLANLPFLVVALILIAVAITRRREVVSWFRERAALAGVAGAAAAVLIGTASNDSGVVLLILGTGYCAAIAGFAWALAARPAPGEKGAPARTDSPGRDPTLR